MKPIYGSVLAFALAASTSSQQDGGIVPTTFDLTFIADTGEIVDLGTGGSISNGQWGELVGQCSFTSTMLDETGMAYTYDEVRVLYRYKDASNNLLEGYPASVGNWMGVNEVIAAEVVQFSSLTGIGTASFRIPIGGSPEHTDDRRAMMPEEATKIRVVLTDGTTPVVDPLGAVQGRIGAQSFSITQHHPETKVFVGEPAGLILGEEDLMCFFHLDNRNTSVETFTIESVPAGAFEPAIPAFALDSGNGYAFEITPQQVGSFRIQLTGDQGTTALSPIYSVHTALATDEPPTGGLFYGGGGDDLRQTEPESVYGKKCNPGSGVKINGDGVFEYCKKPCVRGDQPPPSVNCPKRPGEFGLYYPGYCDSTSDYSYCTETTRQFVSASFIFVGKDTNRHCFSSSSASGGINIGFQHPSGWSVSGGINSGTTTHAWRTACCIYGADPTASPIYITGDDCY